MRLKWPTAILALLAVTLMGCAQVLHEKTSTEKPAPTDRSLHCYLQGGSDSTLTVEFNIPLVDSSNPPSARVEVLLLGKAIDTLDVVAGTPLTVANTYPKGIITLETRHEGRRIYTRFVNNLVYKINTAPPKKS